MEEVWDIFDEQGNRTGKRIRRGELLLPGEYHLVVHIWIKDKNNNLLIQKRATHLEWEPGRWAATGGSAIAGEDSLTAAMRETREEIGILLQPNKMKLITRRVRIDSLLDIWVAEVNIAAEQCVLEDAVSEVRFVTKDELMRMHETGSFVDYRKGEAYTDNIYMEIFDANFARTI